MSPSAATGRPCADFGKSGEVSLRDVADYWEGVYHVTSPPAVVDDDELALTRSLAAVIGERAGKDRAPAFLRDGETAYHRRSLCKA